MVMENLNFLPILVGGIAYMVYGGIYYSIMLSNKSELKSGQTEGPFKYIYSVILAFVCSFLVAILVQATSSNQITEGIFIGLIIGLLISLVYIKNMLFGLISKKACVIAIGDHLIIFTLLGAIHGFLQ
ncbi:DUF1761 domain-containing protein [Cytobacillus spongiae]|uniref:DUF1761 domain-containing protein n=1 Tax=Cytobacillus spongiae TaxID=2901381 RepID=UPI001F43873A|nr:DUF1761 domain-containing protein [Cytobacillus spongiae]UII56405.1 DUF1761 domain-containing protein [Cytobacillus spongiae]